MTDLSIKGFVNLRVINVETGEILEESQHNLITQKGLEVLLRSGLTADAVRFGENGAAPLPSDDLDVMINWIEKPATSAGAGSGESNASRGLDFTLEANEGNGKTIRELALISPYFSDGSGDFIMARQVRAPIIKTPSIRLEGSWWFSLFYTT